MTYRTDANHVPIKNALRQAGFTVIDCAKYGDGFPDLVVITRSGRAVLVEVKTETGAQVKKAQLNFMLQLVEPVYRIVTGEEQAIEVIQEMG